MTLHSHTEAPVRVRFAPSPTGSLHLGSALVALANAAFARSVGGSLLLRIDDTDAARSSDVHARQLEQLLRWLEIDWDEQVRQRERAHAHHAVLERLLQQGRAYRCFCGIDQLREVRTAQVAAGTPPRYDGRCRSLASAEIEGLLQAGTPFVVRLMVDSSREVVVQDAVHGSVVSPAGSFGDPALTRSDGTVGYLLASVVDDVELGITHVIRGEDHLPNAARQQLLFEALGATTPAWAHLPLLRDEQGAKLSKRSPLGTLDELVEEGFLPRTVRRYLAELLGAGAQDLLAADASPFELVRISSGAPRVDRSRLESIGREDVAVLDDVTLLGELHDGVGRAVLPLLRELAAGSCTPVHARSQLQAVLDDPVPGSMGPDEQLVLDHALVLFEHLDPATEAWGAQLVRELRAHGAELGLSTRAVLQPLRRALTGATSGPALGLVLEALGPQRSRARIEACGNSEARG